MGKSVDNKIIQDGKKSVGRLPKPTKVDEETKQAVCTICELPKCVEPFACQTVRTCMNKVAAFKMYPQLLTYIHKKVTFLHQETKKQKKKEANRNHYLKKVAKSVTVTTHVSEVNDGKEVFQSKDSQSFADSGA